MRTAPHETAEIQRVQDCHDRDAPAPEKSSWQQVRAGVLASGPPPFGSTRNVPLHATAQPIRQSLILQLQRRHGNVHVQRAIGRMRSASVPAAHESRSPARASMQEELGTEEPAPASAPLAPVFLERSLQAPAVHRQKIYRQGATETSITPAYAQGLPDGELDAEITAVRRQLSGLEPTDSVFTAARENLGILEGELASRSLRSLEEQGPDFDSTNASFRLYCESRDEAASLGATNVPEDPEGVSIPGNQLVVVDESGQVQLIPSEGLVGIEDDLFPILEDVAAASRSGTAPSTAGGSLEQVLLWSDGRAVFTPPMNGDLATLLNAGT